MELRPHNTSSSLQAISLTKLHLTDTSFETAKIVRIFLSILANSWKPTSEPSRSDFHHLDLLLSLTDKWNCIAVSERVLAYLSGLTQRATSIKTDLAIQPFLLGARHRGDEVCVAALLAVGRRKITWPSSSVQVKEDRAMPGSCILNPMSMPVSLARLLPQRCFWALSRAYMSQLRNGPDDIRVDYSELTDRFKVYLGDWDSVSSRDR